MHVSANHPDHAGEPGRPSGDRPVPTVIALALVCGLAPRFIAAQPVVCDDCRQHRSIAPATAEIAALNLLTWGYDHFIEEARWTNVGPSTWKRNLGRGFTWDGNRLSSNQLMHPLHGGLYFNLARSRGFGYWTSMAGAAFGSLLWEFLGETHPAAGNDFVNTTIGGAALGETMHRLALALAPPSGRPGMGRRAAAGLLNPAGFAAGAFGARWQDDTSLPGRITVSLAAGFDHSLETGADPGTRYRPVLDIGVRFGDPTVDAVRRPFDVFEFHVRAGRGISSGRSYGPDNPVDRLESRGALASTIQTTDRLAIGVYQHIDFFRSPTSEFGAQSITAAVQGTGPVTGSLRWASMRYIQGASMPSACPTATSV